MQRSMTNYIIICLESFWKAKAGRGKVMYIFAVVSIQYSTFLVPADPGGPGHIPDQQ